MKHTDRRKDDIWEWRPTGLPCTDRHAWIYYHSKRLRECCDCGRREDLWADFGLGGINHGTSATPGTA